MSIAKAKILGEMGGGGSGSVTVENITDASDTGKKLLKAEDAAAARQQIAAIGTEGDQVIDGQLQVSEKLTVTAPDLGEANWTTIINIPQPDGTPGAGIDYSHAGGAVFLRLSLRMADGNLRQTLLLSPRQGPNGQNGGVGLLNDSFLLVGNGYALDQVTDTGYAVFTAGDEVAARAAIGAGTSNLTATPLGKQLLQCEDAAAVKALLGITS